MKIIVKADGHNIRLRFPTALLCNRFVLHIVMNIGQKYAPDVFETLQKAQPERFIKIIRQIHKKYGLYQLVEVESADGEHVEIWI